MVARATELAAPRADRSRAGGRRRNPATRRRCWRELCAEVFAIEIVPALAERARRVAGGDRLRQRDARVVRRQRRLAGARAVRRHHRLGGRAAHSAACWSTSSPTAGRLVIPVGGPTSKNWRSCAAQGDHYATSYDTRCRYVDLQGRFGVGGGQPRGLAGARLAAGGGAAGELSLSGARTRPARRERRPARWYVVAPGETLEAIARRADVPMADPDGDQRARRRRRGAPGPADLRPGLAGTAGAPDRAWAGRDARVLRSPPRARPLRWPLATGRIVVGSPFGTR